MCNLINIHTHTSAPEREKLSKCFFCGNIGCVVDKNKSSWHLIGFFDGSGLVRVNSIMLGRN